MSENKNTKQTETKKIPVEVMDIHMPFMSMVSFMVKWAFATIPAIIIIYMIVASIPLIFSSFI